MEDEREGDNIEEMNIFFSERPAMKSSSPFEWWKINASRFPNLAKLARNLLCVPATADPAEQVFSASGILVNKLHCSLLPSNVDAVIFTAKNRLPVSVASSVLQVAVPTVAMEQGEEEEEEEESIEPSLPSLNVDSESEDSDTRFAL